jgi:hypothetical protein
MKTEEKESLKMNTEETKVQLSPKGGVTKMSLGIIK